MKGTYNTFRKLFTLTQLSDLIRLCKVRRNDNKFAKLYVVRYLRTELQHTLLAEFQVSMISMN